MYRRLDEKVEILTKMIKNLSDNSPKSKDDDKDKYSVGVPTDDNGGISGVHTTYDKEDQPNSTM